MSVSLLQRVSQHLSDAGLLAGYDVVYLKWTDQRIAENKPFALFRLAGTEGVSNHCVQYPDVRILLVGLPTTAVDTLDDMAAIIEHFRQDFTEVGIDPMAFEPIGPIIGPLYLENGRPVVEITVRCLAEDAYLPRETADKTALLAALNSASALIEGDYTADSWAVLAAAVSVGQAVYDDTYALQSDVDDAAAAILAAIAALELFPLQLFAAAQEGAWLSQEDTGTLFQDTAGLVPVAADGQSEGLILDKSGNDNNAYQSTTLAKMTYNTDGVYHWASLDGDDDAILFDVPAGGWNGTYVQGTMAGVIVGQISVPEGVYQIPTKASYANAGTMTELFIRNDDGVIDPAELEQLIGYAGRRGAVADFAAGGDFTRYFQDRDDITEIDFSRTNPPSAVIVATFLRASVVRVDISGLVVADASAFAQASNMNQLVSEGADFSACVRINNMVRATSLVELDISDWDLSSNTIAKNFASDAGSLTTVTVYGGTASNFAASPCTDYTNAFINTNLTQQSIDDILTAIELAGTSNGTFNQSGGSAPSATGEAAIDALRARGWTVTVTGGY